MTRDYHIYSFIKNIQLFFLLFISSTILLGEEHNTIPDNIKGLRFFSQDKPIVQRTSLSLFTEPIYIESKIHLAFDFKIYDYTKFGNILNIKKIILKILPNMDISV